MLQTWQRYHRTELRQLILVCFMVWVKLNLEAELGVSKDKADELFDTYHAKVPFVKQLMNQVNECCSKQRSR